jgi:hypothetical protein
VKPIDVTNPVDVALDLARAVDVVTASETLRGLEHPSEGFLSDEELMIAIAMWRGDRVSCLGAMADSAAEQSAPLFPATLFGWLLFGQWCFAQFGEVPSAA